MDTSVNIAIEDFFKLFDNSKLKRDYLNAKNTVRSNKEIIDLINLLNNSVKDDNYKKLKNKLYQYKEYQEYIYLEQQINYLIMYMNKEFKSLLKG